MSNITSKVGITVDNVVTQPEYSSLGATPGVIQNITYTGTGYTNSVITNLPDFTFVVTPSFTVAANQITINESGHYLLSYSSYTTLDTPALHYTAIFRDSIPISRSTFSVTDDKIYATVTGTQNLIAGQVITLRTYLGAGATIPLNGTTQGGVLTILKLKV